jgi:N-acetyl-gamma-glutamyl-phosphate reductase
MIQVGIVGGTGYTGVELLRLLAQHPQVRIHAVTSRQDEGTPVAQMFPSLRGVVEIAFSTFEKAPLTECDVVFFATPHGVAMQQAPPLLEAGVKVIDLSADFRLRDLATWEKWYGMPHTAPTWAEQAVYGLAETHRLSIRTAQLVANPGCYPTAVQLGLLPLLEAGVIELNTIIADCKSGVSGAGRKAHIQHLFAEASDNFAAYGVSGHRHLPEIQQALQNMIQGKAVGLTFVPHLTPMIRGMQATLYVRLTQSVDIQALYEKRYAQEAFIDVMPAGSLPQTRSVRGANTCRLALYQPQENTVVILSVIDNLMKGAAGQAVQNMNIMCDFKESAGLQVVPLLP